jgi:hypothetical protein
MDYSKPPIRQVLNLVQMLIAAAANTSPDRFEKIEMALVRHQNHTPASDDIS